jgi:hypothetical protein
MSNDKLQDLLEEAVRLGEAGAAKLTAYKNAVLRKFDEWPELQPWDMGIEGT